MDQKMTFNSHINNTISATNPRINALKAIESQNWITTPILRTAYTAIVRSKLEYGCPVWAPNTADSNIEKLQRVQNSGLRIVTGCHRSTPIDVLHQEAKVLKTKAHTDMISCQFLASARHQQGHPCNNLANSTERPRAMKHTLASKYHSKIQTAINNLNNKRPTPTATHQNIKQQIHTDAVNLAINSYKANPVLNDTPPTVNESADNLPRRIQKLGAQLRSGHSIFLNSYRHRINNETSNLCPHCKTAIDDTRHLFACPNAPIGGRLEDLWNNPQITFDIEASRSDN